MENKKKVISRGYTFEVKSWENDGDHSKTKHHTVESEFEARRIFKLCKELFPSVGNSMEGECRGTVLGFIADNMDLFPSIDSPEAYIQGLAYDLMDGSECYDYRVIEKMTLTYSSEDVYLSIVEF